jgi:hypothetical protein
MARSARLIFARSFFVVFGFALALGAGGMVSIEFCLTVSAEELHSRADNSNAATREAVWRAVVADLGRRGILEEQWPRAGELDLPGALGALSGRRVRVVSACWDERPERTEFRLECGIPAECLPFLVYWRSAGRENAGAEGDDNPGAHASSCRLASGRRTALEAAPKLAVRPGDRARAVFVSAGLRMTASVTCLDRGREGEVIRVRALDGHIFRARISAPGLLNALPQQ